MCSSESDEARRSARSQVTSKLTYGIVVSGSLRIWTVCSEGRDLAVDETGIQLPNDWIAQVHLLHGARSKNFKDNVVMREKPSGRLKAIRISHVDGYAMLSACDDHK